jgi:hypothetical protein
MPPATTQTSTPATTDASNTSSGARTLYDPSSGDNLNTQLNSNFENSDQYTGILDRYNQASSATAANTNQTGQYLQDMYGQNVNYQTGQNNAEQTSSNEGRVGFATNVAALTNLQAQGAQRVKQLTDQANQALMANNAAGAQSLSDLAVQEQTALTNARTNFLNNYFGSQQEARAQASFQTPEQQSVMTLSGQYPDANILPTDSLQDAEAKIKSSPTYSANLAKVNQDIATAQAAATASNSASQYSLAQTAQVPELTKIQEQEAQAAQTSASASAEAAGGSAAADYANATQTKFLTGLYQGTGGSTSSDVTALLNNQMTPQQLQAKYANVPNGGLIATQILNQAQSEGYNVNTGTLSGTAQQSQVEAMNSGNPLTEMTSWLGSLAGTASKSLSSSNNAGVAPSGVSYTIGN